MLLYAIAVFATKGYNPKQSYNATVELVSQKQNYIKVKASTNFQFHSVLK